MGGRNRTRTQRKHFKESRENVWKRPKPEENSSAADENPKPSWEPFIIQSPAFEQYYKEQGIVAPEEWDAFMDCLKTALPAAFRINSSSPFYVDIRTQLENDFMTSLQAEDGEGNERAAIKPLPWYPNNLAWHSEYSRKQLRKNQTLSRFHEFLKLANEIGNITRQEAVSMVPPLFLDVHPDHFVLDMCAAPGSKTFQLLEMIHPLTESGALPNGMVVANDVDIQRCNLLIHQTKRMCTANLIVTTHEAQHFPGCHIKRSANACDAGNLKKHDISQLLFDRVLCDVPCSGDGTLRKAPDIWRKWNPGMGCSLHGLQILIAMRGLSLLKVGGKMVYSTCSMNPIENEAVVAEILRRCKGSVEIVDVSTELPQLIRRPGLKKWKVKDKGVWFNSYKDVPENRRAVIVPCMFPTGRTFEDTTENKNSTVQSEQDAVEEISTLPLEHCMRIVPHDQNTGAFFIAVLHKLSDLPAVENKSIKRTWQVSSTEALTEMVDAIESMNSDDVTDDQVCDADVPVPMIVSDISLHDETSVESGSGVVALKDKAEDVSVQVTTHSACDSETVEASFDSDPSGLSVEKEVKDIEPSKSDISNPKVVGEKRKLQIKGRWVGVDPVVFYKDETAISNIKEFFGIGDSFPFVGHLITRNPDMNHVKRIYYVSNPVKEVLELNLLAGQSLKIASVGMKMFERQSPKEGMASLCSFRISSEGLPLLLPHITKQILYAPAVVFRHILQYKSIKFADFADAEFGNKALQLSLGCCIVVLNKENKSDMDHRQVNSIPIAIGCWRGRNSVSVMVTAMDCQELLERISCRSVNDTTPEHSAEPVEVIESNDAKTEDS